MESFRFSHCYSLTLLLLHPPLSNSHFLYYIFYSPSFCTPIQSQRCTCAPLMDGQSLVKSLMLSLVCT